MQERSVTINNSVLPSVYSQMEENEISKSDTYDTNDRWGSRPGDHDPLSVFGGIPATFYHEPSTLERPRSRSQSSVVSSRVCESMCLCLCVCVLVE